MYIRNIYVLYLYYSKVLGEFYLVNLSNVFVRIFVFFIIGVFGLLNVLVLCLMYFILNCKVFIFFGEIEKKENIRENCINCFFVYYLSD